MTVRIVDTVLIVSWKCTFFLRESQPATWWWHCTHTHTAPGLQGCSWENTRPLSRLEIISFKILNIKLFVNDFSGSSGLWDKCVKLDSNFNFKDFAPPVWVNLSRLVSTLQLQDKFSIDTRLLLGAKCYGTNLKKGEWFSQNFSTTQFSDKPPSSASNQTPDKVLAMQKNGKIFEAGFWKQMDI